MNGYAELTILGRKRGLKFGTLAFERLGAALDIIEQSGEYYTTKFTADLVYAGLVNNCYRKNEQPDFTYQDVFDFVDDNANDPEVVKELAAVIKAFEQSKPLQDALEAVNKASEESKKKAGRKSKSSPSVS